VKHAWLCSLLGFAIAASACGSNEDHTSGTDGGHNTTKSNNADSGNQSDGNAGTNDACGALEARKCSDLESCTIDDDCAVGSCVLGVCNAIATACTTETVAASEGASALKLCDGSSCETDDACASGICTSSVCAPIEQKVCGVGLPAACDNGEVCQSAADCTSDYCDKTCGPPPDDVHSNGKRDGGETGIDCGGSVRKEKPCTAGQACLISDDCEGACDGGTCAAPSATDGKQNQGETDIDCGGPNAPGCTFGKTCVSNTDCLAKACTDSVCVQPTSTDGVQNGGESDVDCGGSGVTDGDFTYTPPRCIDGKTCAVAGDCMTKACSPASQCVAPSCNTAETAGITSCGAGETGQAGAVRDSCCTSLPLPSRTTRRLDKYEITSGRFRTFLTQVGPNIRGWVTNFVAANPQSQMATIISNASSVKMGSTSVSLTSILPATQSGDLGLTAHMSLDIDNYSGIRGCYNGLGNYSANTYWQTPQQLTEFGLPPRQLVREISDEKPLNCAMPIMYAAFCAWDGGELAMQADYQDVWSGSYPWLATNVCPGGIGQACPNYNWCNGSYGNGGFYCQNQNYNVGGDGAGIFYEYPRNTDRSNDNEPLIAAPGRMVNDASTKQGNGQSWMDLFANMIEYTGNFSGSSDFCDFSGAPVAGAVTCTRSGKYDSDGVTLLKGTQYTGIPVTPVVGNSWEGHQYSTNGIGTTTFQVTFQYGKFGGRCARPAQ